MTGGGEKKIHLDSLYGGSCLGGGRGSGNFEEARAYVFV